MRPLALFLVFLTASLIGGCTYDTSLDERSCHRDRECATGYFCEAGYCQVRDVVTLEPDSGLPPDVSGCHDEDEDGYFFGDDCPQGDELDCNDSRADINPGEDEVCDEVDHDCDGVPGDGDPDLEALPLCSPPEGQSELLGVCAGRRQTCPEGVQTICAEGNPAYHPDYVTDEGYCATPLDDNGLCQGATLHERPADYLCDAKDNDCDGEVDEGLQANCFSGNVAQIGVGACRVGRLSCDDGVLACAGEVLPIADAGETACNGIDDNCDGVIDENCGCPEEGRTESCYTGPDGTVGVGICLAGTRTCGLMDNRLVWSACSDTPPTAETCDNLLSDDDCDGNEDDIGGSEYGSACDFPAMGECGRGERECTDGTFGCAQKIFPGNETCNNAGDDNDCDGETDDVQLQGGGQVVLGTECTLPDLIGPCATGEYQCGSGSSAVCTQTVSPVSITADNQCDNVDDDCDGSIDEYAVANDNACGDCATVCAANERCNTSNQRCQ